MSRRAGRGGPLPAAARDLRAPTRSQTSRAVVPTSSLTSGPPRGLALALAGFDGMGAARRGGGSEWGRSERGGLGGEDAVAGAAAGVVGAARACAAPGECWRSAPPAAEPSAAHCPPPARPRPVPGRAAPPPRATPPSASTSAPLAPGARSTVDLGGLGGVQGVGWPMGKGLVCAPPPGSDRGALRRSSRRAAATAVAGEGWGGGRGARRAPQAGQTTSLRSGPRRHSSAAGHPRARAPVRSDSGRPCRVPPHP
jgi:hypothetical protein